MISIVRQGKPPEYTTPLSLRKSIQQYFEDCERDNICPDEAGMMLTLDIVGDEIEKLVGDDNPEAEGYRRAFKQAELLRESWMVRHAAENPRASSAMAMMLKQDKNGGYIDKAKSEKGTTIKIKTEGLGDLNLFG